MSTQGISVTSRFRAVCKEAYVPMAVLLIGVDAICGLVVLTGHGAPHAGPIERLEALVLMGCMGLGPIAFLIRNHTTTRKALPGIATEDYIHTAVFQNALHALMSRPLPKDTLHELRARSREK